jgi:hypothetical protein
VLSNSSNGSNSSNNNNSSNDSKDPAKAGTTNTGPAEAGTTNKVVGNSPPYEQSTAGGGCATYSNGKGLAPSQE